ncbi:hypothetical protein CI15_17270 [Paraburkholderia monticola]|uniref:Uncharacterized protein n=1 Tax=Paraburkholderia monticola TaxID=1399968 RepID=A0A149PML1_9BURK|nr:hypothetical protein CI15_17270 [Paraburkholderia monticola]
MSFVSNPFRAPRRKRLTCTVAIIALCALAGACSNDDPPASTNTISSTDHSAASPGEPSTAAAPAEAAPPALTIQTPAAPASEAGTALSATAPPLASPVIHTVD